MEYDTGSGSDPGAASSMPDQHATGELAGTGDSRVDAALRGLGELDELPVSEHPGVYERVHEQLVDMLGELHPAQSPGSQTER